MSACDHLLCEGTVKTQNMLDSWIGTRFSSMQMYISGIFAFAVPSSKHNGSKCMYRLLVFP